MTQKKTNYAAAVDKSIRIMKKMQDEAETIRQMIRQGKELESYPRAYELERMTERLAITTRYLPIHTGNKAARSEVERIMDDEVPVEMGFTEEGWFCLRMPMLLPKKEGGTADYIRGFLYPACERFFREVPAFEKLDKCYVILRHVYDQERPEREYRDHDNIEVNMVVDTVAFYLMRDDAPLKCWHMYCSAPGTLERTEAYVIPREDIHKWLDVMENIPDEGVAFRDEGSFLAEKAM